MAFSRIGSQMPTFFARCQIGKSDANFGVSTGALPRHSRRPPHARRRCEHHPGSPRHQHQSKPRARLPPQPTAFLSRCRGGIWEIWRLASLQTEAHDGVCPLRSELARTGLTRDSRSTPPSGSACTRQVSITKPATG